jgi:hypothetical protein
MRARLALYRRCRGPRRGSTLGSSNDLTDGLANGDSCASRRCTTVASTNDRKRVIRVELRDFLTFREPAG